MLEINSINTRIFYIKYCLLAFTILFALTGLSLVIIGSTINAVFTEFSFFLENKYFVPAVFLYSLGFAVFAISIIGLIGSIKENSYIVTTYGVLLGIVFVLQVTIGISTNILMHRTIYDQLKEKITVAMTAYDSNPEYKIHVNALQQGIACCGVFSPSDWNALNHDSGEPISCCGKLDVNGTCVFRYRRGCFQVIKIIVNDVANILSVSAYVLAIMQLAGMCFAVYMGKVLRAQKTAKQYHRMRLTNQLFNPGEGPNNCFTNSSDKKQQESPAMNYYNSLINNSNNIINYSNNFEKNSFPSIN